MTTKEVLQLTKIIELLEGGIGVNEQVRQKVAGKQKISSVKKNYNLGLYKQYASALDGCMYYSDEIDFNEQAANYFSCDTNYLEFATGTGKEKLRSKMLSIITGFDTVKISKLYGKTRDEAKSSRDNLLLYDLDRIDEIEDRIRSYVMMNTTDVLKRFSKIKPNGIVSGTKFYGIELFSMSESCIHVVADKVLEFMYNGEFELIPEDKKKDIIMFSKEIFLRQVAKAVSTDIKRVAKLINASWYETICLWESSLVEDDGLSSNSGILGNHTFANVVYYKQVGINNLSEECRKELNEQLAENIACMYDRKGFKKIGGERNAR
ncbi:MAG: hypothetical protein ACRCTZ_16155 [Sarcina sp.]